MVDLEMVFFALANSHRRTIVQRLALQPRAINELAEQLDMSLPAIHKHLRILEDAGMIRRRKVGRTNFLALERAPLQSVLEWINAFHPWWGTDGESLENYVAHLQKSSSNEKESK